MWKAVFALAVVVVIISGAYLIHKGRRMGSVSCGSNLRSIEAVKAQWAVDVRGGSGASPGWSDLVGPAKSMKQVPLCPGGGVYTIGTIDENPRCSLGGRVPGHELPGGP